MLFYYLLFSSCRAREIAAGQTPAHHARHWVSLGTLGIILETPELHAVTPRHRTPAFVRCCLAVASTAHASKRARSPAAKPRRERLVPHAASHARTKAARLAAPTRSTALDFRTDCFAGEARGLRTAPRRAEGAIMGGFLSRHDKRIRDWMDSDDEAPSAYCLLYTSPSPRD